MAVERIAATTSMIDVLDRVLDKGIVIDAWVRVSLIGISLITVRARILVASFETHLKHADLATQLRLWSLPALEPVEPPHFDGPAIDMISRHQSAADRKRSRR
jgi:hypothetical protein